MPRYCSRISASWSAARPAHSPTAACGYAGEAASEGLGEAVGERLEQYLAIIVMRRLEAIQMRLDAVDADRETADPVAFRVDEVGKQKFARSALFFTCWRRKGIRNLPLPSGEGVRGGGGR